LRRSEILQARSAKKIARATIESMRRPATLVKAVVFDFGYTLISEDRVWGAIAAQHGWPMSVFFATLGTVIERRGHHRDVFELLGAAKPYEPVAFEPRDFYKDALPSVRALKGRSCVVGIAGNMRAEIERFLSRHVDVDFIASSERWGVEKPDPDFFARIVAAAKAPPEDIATSATGSTMTSCLPRRRECSPCISSAAPGPRSSRAGRRRGRRR
jgi:hypothetical protein